MSWCAGRASGSSRGWIRRRFRRCCRRCEGAGDRAAGRPQGRDGGTPGRFSQVGAHAVGAGERSIAREPVLRRRVRVPLQACGQSEASGVGRQRHGAGDEVVASGGLHLAADPRRRGTSERDPAHDAARWTRLDAGLAKACEATGCRRMRCEDFAGAYGEGMYLSVMAIRPEALSTDAAVLTEMVLALDAENEKLRVAMQTLKDMIFGKRSERFAVIVAEQLALELDDLATGVMPPAPANDDAPATKPPARPRQKARRNIGALPKHLPRCEQVLEPDTTACPCCEGRLHKIGEDVSEVLDVIPAILRVLRTIRPKYACRGCTDGVVQAKVLPRLIESGMASTALVSHVVVSKFAWYLPLYRQVQILAGQGVHLDRATLAGWVKRAAWWLKSLYELQLRTIQASPRLFCDETPMPVLDPGRHHTRTCQFWAHAMDDRPWGGPSPPAVAYVFADGRGTDKIARQLTGFSGILQVDGYAAYKALARGHGGAIRLAFCLAHARRKFVEVYKTTQSPFAHEVIERLQAVYAIETEIRGSGAEQRLAARRTRTAPLMETLRTRLTAMVGQLFSQSKLTEAINYALNHWDGLTLFLSDGRVEVDTNTVERSMRPIAMGRRNSLFSGSEGGAESWAILASLVNTAKLHELDPQAYLADVLERIVSGRTKSHQLHELLAWNWKAAQARIAQAAA